MPENPPDTLTTEHLILRPFEKSDSADVQNLASAFEIARYTRLPHPYEEGMAAEWIEKQHREYAEGLVVNFAIVRKEDDALMGSMGLKLDQNHRRGELGYWIGVPFWNNGYCTEAAREVVNYGFSVLDLHRIYAVHLGTNEYSGRVLKKLGMKYEGRQRQHFYAYGEWEDVELHGMLKEEYMSNDKALN